MDAERAADNLRTRQNEILEGRVRFQPPLEAGATQERTL
jgi:hypothetical protein